MRRSVSQMGRTPRDVTDEIPSTVVEKVSSGVYGGDAAVYLGEDVQPVHSIRHPRESTQDWTQAEDPPPSPLWIKLLVSRIPLPLERIYSQPPFAVNPSLPGSTSMGQRQNWRSRPNSSLTCPEEGSSVSVPSTTRRGTSARRFVQNDLSSASTTARCVPLIPTPWPRLTVSM